MNQDAPLPPHDEFDERLLAELDVLGREARRCSPEAISRIARMSAASLPSARPQAMAPSALPLRMAHRPVRSTVFGSIARPISTHLPLALAAMLVVGVTLATLFIMLRSSESDSSFAPTNELVAETPPSSGTQDSFPVEAALLPVYLERALARDVSSDASAHDGMSEGMSEGMREGMSEAALLHIASEATDVVPSGGQFGGTFGAVLASRAVHFDEFEAELRDLAGERSSF